MSYGSWGHKEPDTTELLSTQQSVFPASLGTIVNATPFSVLICYYAFTHLVSFVFLYPVA